jgi:hypothetical protein
MTVIYAGSALQKFLDARARGASRQELLELKMAAMPGAPRAVTQAPVEQQRNVESEAEREWSNATLTDD